MKFTPLNIHEVIIIEPDIYEDERGFFFEAFNQKKFSQTLNRDITFVQDNHSKSQYGVLRGLHYQEAPFVQAKLVRCVSGEIFDVAVDIRPNSKTYGKWVSEIISKENKKQLWIPEGFAHGFLVLSDEAEVIYKTTQFHSKEHDHCIQYNDRKINITWPSLEREYILSTRDLNGHSLI
jgi:dTDP-4-dehydrorhamnose 3,5-epimerase